MSLSATAWSSTPCRATGNGSPGANEACAPGAAGSIGVSAAAPAALARDGLVAIAPTAEKAGPLTAPARSGRFEVRLAESAADIEAAQALRYRIFYEKMGARPLPEMARHRRDADRFDAVCDHLLVCDRSRGAKDGIVGTYRLIRRKMARRLGGFYSESEYDIAPLLAYPGAILELGRSCVDPAYRLAPPELRPRALAERYVSMDRCPTQALDPVQALAALPPLIKGYLRLGGFVGDGAVIDEQFNTTDVCIVVRTDLVTQKYSRHYMRQSQDHMGRPIRWAHRR